MTWTTTLIESDDAVIGVPISPRGYALRQRVRLPHREWQLVLGHGDPVLDIHVPAEGVLTLDGLRDALCQAEAFLTSTIPSVPLWPTCVTPGSSFRSSQPCWRRIRTFCILRIPDGLFHD